MFKDMLYLLHIPHPEIFHILLLFSTVLELITALQGTGIPQGFFYLFRKVSSALVLVFQRYVVYLLMIVLNKIASTYVNIKLPVEAIVYIMESTALLHLAYNAVRDNVAKRTIEALLSVVHKQAPYTKTLSDKITDKSSGDSAK